MDAFAKQSLKEAIAGYDHMIRAQYAVIPKLEEELGAWEETNRGLVEVGMPTKSFMDEAIKAVLEERARMAGGPATSQQDELLEELYASYDIHVMPALDALEKKDALEKQIAEIHTTLHELQCKRMEMVALLASEM